MKCLPATAAEHRYPLQRLSPRLLASKLLKLEPVTCLSQYLGREMQYDWWHAVTAAHLNKDERTQNGSKADGARCAGTWESGHHKAAALQTR
jgi:hypothetical protein